MPAHHGRTNALPSLNPYQTPTHFHIISTTNPQTYPQDFHSLSTANSQLIHSLLKALRAPRARANENARSTHCRPSDRPPCAICTLQMTVYFNKLNPRRQNFVSPFPIHNDRDAERPACNYTAIHFSYTLRFPVIHAPNVYSVSMPNFSRRHYETLAACIRVQREQAISRGFDLRSLECLASAITLELELDNARFDRAKFETACEPRD